MTRPALDPEIAAFVAEMKQDWARHPPFTSLPLVEARAVAEQVRERWRAGGPRMRETRSLLVETSAGPLPIRLHDPGAAEPGPALVYLHGGGFVLFSLDSHDRLMREYAAAGGFRVIGVDYPLSPEARYPRALDLLVAFGEHLKAGGAAELGVDPDRVAFGGDSAGGNLAMGLALRLRDRKAAFQPRALLLNYAVLGGEFTDEVEALHGGPGSVLDRAEMDFYLASYLGEATAAPDDPYVRPIRADLDGLPPTFLVVAECDILAEQNLEMAERMRAAGIDVACKVYPGATHSFLEAMSVSKLAREAIADSAEWLRGELGAPPPASANPGRPTHSASS